MKIFILFLIASLQFAAFGADITEVYVKGIAVVQRLEAEVDIASATTTTLAGVNSSNLRITGTGGISSFGAATAGLFKRGRFAGALTLTHSSNLILPGAVNFTTSANDRWEAWCLSSGTWIVNLWKADGTAVVGGGGSGDFSSAISSSTNNNLIVFSGTGGKTGKDSKIFTDGVGGIRTPGTIETGADSGAAGATAWGDGSGHTYRLSPQTMSGNANFQPDTAPTSGIPLHTATGTNVVETHLGSNGSGNVARVTSPTFVTPTLGAATATTINGTAIPSSATLMTTADAAPAFTALTDGATITWTLDATKTVQNAAVQIAGARTLAFSGLVAGMSGTLIVKEDSTGGRSITLPASSKVISGGSGTVTLTATASAFDILTFTYDGTNTYWNIGKNYN